MKYTFLFVLLLALSATATAQEPMPPPPLEYNISTVSDLIREAMLNLSPDDSASQHVQKSCIKEVKLSGLHVPATMRLILPVCLCLTP